MIFPLCLICKSATIGILVLFCLVKNNFTIKYLVKIIVNEPLLVSTIGNGKDISPHTNLEDKPN